MKLAALARSPFAWLVGAGVVGLGVMAYASAVEKARPLADRIKVGSLFRADVRSPYFTADEVCMRATRLAWKDGHVVQIWARLEDRRHPGDHFIEHEVSPAHVRAVTPPGSSACASPVSFRWVEITDEDHVVLRKGLAYRACVNLPPFVPAALVRGKIVPALTARGFTEVTFEEDPTGYGLSCDFVIEGRWSREDQQIERPGAVTKAWREG